MELVVLTHVLRRSLWFIQWLGLVVPNSPLNVLSDRL